jgi:nucleoside 2-deoxyribosyltransferase
MICEGVEKDFIKESKEGVKFDQGKDRYDLIPGYPLNELAKVYTYGTTKYDANNWRRGMLWGRVFGAMMRHAWTFWRGQSIDPESGLHHLAHTAWQCFTLMEYEKTKLELDDRFKDLVIEKVEPVEKHFKEVKKEKLRIYLAGTTTATHYRETVHKFFDTYKCFELVDPMKFETQNSIACVQEDKDAILTCDYVVAWIEKATFGTVMEIPFSYMNNIPVLTICYDNYIQNDPWLQAHTYMYFKSINECFEYLLAECILKEQNK